MLIVLIFILTLAMGVPIAFSLGITGFVHMLTLDIPSMLTLLTQRMFTAADNYSLLAIPLFILYGELLEKSGDVARLADFARALVGA